MEVAAPSSLSPLQGPRNVNQNGASPLPPHLAAAATHAATTGTPPLPSNTAMLMTMVTPPPGLLSHPIAPAQLYPAPLAKHEEVAASQKLFLDTLSKFHAALGTRLAIPKMGGKDLDLHVLYVEVTQRGGLQQVIKDRKWKEITGAFNFPRTTTSASFVLRKVYITQLHHYEQVYFFGANGHLIAPPTPLPAPSPVTIKRNQYASAPYPQASEEELEGVSTDGRKARKRKLVPIQMNAPADPTASLGHIVTGAIEGKFEHGYLVTIMVGTEKMRGVVYHVPPGNRGPQYAHVPNYALTVGDEVQLPEKEAKVRKRRQREELKKDPNAPRANRTGYNFFFAEERAKLKLLYPDKERELSRMIGDAWNSLSEEQKMPYQDRGVKDKERYKNEMREYKESLNAGVQGARQEAAAEAGRATDGDRHVAATAEAEPPSSAPAQLAFNLEQRPQTPQGAAAPLPPQHSPQPPSVNVPPVEPGSSPVAAPPPPQQPDQAHENISKSAHNTIVWK